MRTLSAVPRLLYKSSCELGTPLHTGQPAGSKWCPIERFHCIQDSQLGPNGVLYREVPLYCTIISPDCTIAQPASLFLFLSSLPSQLADTTNSHRLTYRQFVHLLLLSSRARLQDRLKFSYMLHLHKEKTLEAWRREVQLRQKQKETASTGAGSCELCCVHLLHWSSSSFESSVYSHRRTCLWYSVLYDTGINYIYYTSCSAVSNAYTYCNIAMINTGNMVIVMMPWP